MFSSADPYKNQQYSELKKACIKDKELFEDPEFPATNTSLFFRRSPPGRVEWKRPGEISDSPQLFVEGISAHDLNQGIVGNCWFVAACSCLALKPNLWKRVRSYQKYTAVQTSAKASAKNIVKISVVLYGHTLKAMFCF